jgi:hypothetical protein
MLKNTINILIITIGLLSVSYVSADRNINYYHLANIVNKEWSFFNAGLIKRAPKNSRTRWKIHFTPPMPYKWPPVANAKSKTVYYGYPGGINSKKLKRQEYRGGPWIKVTVDADKKVKKEILTNKLSLIENQATWLKRYKSYHKVYKKNHDAPRLVANFTRRTLTNASQTKKIRAYYCHWQNTEVIASSIKKRHWNFFKWLNCK